MYFKSVSYFKILQWVYLYVLYIDMYIYTFVLYSRIGISYIQLDIEGEKEYIHQSEINVEIPNKFEKVE